MTPNVLIGYSRCHLTREAFERAGCNAWTCDLLPSSHPNHLQGDVWHFLHAYKWSMVVLHPMCTYLTVSGAWAFKDPPFHIKIGAHVLTGQARRDARDEAIQNFLALLDLPFPVAIENPSPSMVTVKPSQIIHPYQFGDDGSKSTGLWLTKGVPLLKPTGYVLPRLVMNKGRLVRRWSNQAASGAPRLPPSADRWLERSRTWPGIAAAIGDQWGQWLNNKL